MRNNGGARRGGKLLLLLGAVLMLCGAWVLLRVPDNLQYILPAPDTVSTEGALAALYEQGMKQLAGMDDVLTETAVAARWQGAGLSSDDGRRSVTATVYAVGAGYFDLAHEQLMQGRFVSVTDVRQAERVVVLDIP